MYALAFLFSVSVLVGSHWDRALMKGRSGAGESMARRAHFEGRALSKTPLQAVIRGASCSDVSC